VQIRRYDVIYNLTDDLRKALEGMLAPEKREAELGRALVQQVFKISPRRHCGRLPRALGRCAAQAPGPA